MIALFKYPIVKPYLPDITKYQSYIEDIYKRCWLTNNGPLVQLLQQRLAEYLRVDNLLLVCNGTVALQVAYKALEIEGNVITTPFSFAASASSLCWQGLTPKFIDIDATSLNISMSNVDQKLLRQSSAILGVHVFGNPCNVDEIDNIANQNGLKVVYDAAHAFGSNVSGQSVLRYGDASTLSLHATKLFHCIEGGAIIFKRKNDLERAKHLINFGFDEKQRPQSVGINAKMSEVHAAMGLAVLDDIESILDKRKELTNLYHSLLEGVVELQVWHSKGKNNGAYMPILFSDEAQLITVRDILANKGIQTRRYFYPCLSQVEAYGENGETPVASCISSRVLCLPLYTDLLPADVRYICDSLIKAL